VIAQAVAFDDDTAKSVPPICQKTVAAFFGAAERAGHIRAVAGIPPA